MNLCDACVHNHVDCVHIMGGVVLEGNVIACKEYKLKGVVICRKK